MFSVGFIAHNCSLYSRGKRVNLLDQYPGAQRAGDTSSIHIIKYWVFVSNGDGGTAGLLKSIKLMKCRLEDETYHFLPNLFGPGWPLKALWIATVSNWNMKVE